jgi:hypothetical protein
MPIGAGFIIEYPATVSPASELTTSLVYYKNVAYPQGWYINTSKKRIEIRRGLPIAIPAGETLIVKFGPIFNP